MEAYPETNAVLVRRHGVYVWGGNGYVPDWKRLLKQELNPFTCVENWEKAKTMTECYDYLFEIAVKMKSIGLDPAAKPANEPDYE